MKLRYFRISRSYLLIEEAFIETPRGLPSIVGPRRQFVGPCSTFYLYMSTGRIPNVVYAPEGAAFSNTVSFSVGSSYLGSPCGYYGGPPNRLRASRPVLSMASFSVLDAFTEPTNMSPVTQRQLFSFVPAQGEPSLLWRNACANRRHTGLCIRGSALRRLMHGSKRMIVSSSHHLRIPSSSLTEDSDGPSSRWTCLLS